jgi:hypothetical protein
LAQTLLNGSCLGSARQTWLIWLSIPSHNNVGLHISCHHLVRHSTSFLSPLMHPPPRHPILASGRRSIHLLPRIRLTLAPTLNRAVAIARPRGRFISCAHHRFYRRRTSHSSSRPSSCSSSPSCCPRQRLQPRADRRSSTRVRGESVMLLAFLHAFHRGGHDGACHT